MHDSRFSEKRHPSTNCWKRLISRCAAHHRTKLPLHAAVVRAVASQSPEAARKAVTALLDDTDETLVAAVEA